MSGRAAVVRTAVVLAAADLPDGAEASAAAVLSAAEAEPLDGRVLSPGRASEIIVAGAEGRETALATLLREALPGVDVALLPEAGRRKRLLVADMDATMVLGETIDELAAALGRRDEVAAITERAMRGELDFEAALDARVAMLEGLEEAEVARIADGLTYQPGADALVATMKAHGAECVLVSGGFEPFTRAVRERLGFDLDRANRLEAEGGRLTGRAARPVVGREAKLSTLRERAGALGLDLSETMAIGDGANDLAMIEAAGLGIAWQGKPALKAATAHWIDHADLRAALWFQGYTDAEIVGAPV